MIINGTRVILSSKTQDIACKKKKTKHHIFHYPVTVDVEGCETNKTKLADKINTSKEI